MASDPELSFIIPCLNESLCLEKVIEECHYAGTACKTSYEIIVADNGSTDGSQLIAQECGAVLINVPERGYGSAIRAGIAASRGKFGLMGDADGTYAFIDAPSFLNELRSGKQLVMGNRFRGNIEKGAMPFLHRYLGNPVLSFIGRVLFGIEVGDFHCGLRGFCCSAISRLRLHSVGMEFASEMVIKASLMDLVISEVPTDLRRDPPGRKPHLRTWRDGWRHLRFMLSFSPKYSLIPLAIALLSLSVASTVFYANNLAPFSGPNTLVVASSCLTAGLALISDYITNRLIIAKLYAYKGSRRLGGLLRYLSSYKGTNALFQSSLLLLIAGLLLLLQIAPNLGSTSVSSRESHLFSFSGIGLLVGSFFSYLTASKLATLSSLRPEFEQSRGNQSKAQIRQEQQDAV